MHAQRAREVFPDILQRNPDVSDAFLFDVQKRYITLALKDGAAIGAYKGGFIPRAPVGGVVFRHGIMHGTPTIERADFVNLMVEAEIAFALCAPRTSAFADVAALREATCKVYPAIELPDAAFADVPGLLNDFTQLRRQLIPVNIAASHLLLGAPMAPAALDLDRLDVRVNFNGTQIGARAGADAKEDIWSRVLWIINEFIIANGYPIGPEHVIIPGALTGLHPGTAGHYTVDYGALGVVDFDIR
jgi:2-keto-4-pentenoate hydratase